MYGHEKSDMRKALQLRAYYKGEFHGTFDFWMKKTTYHPNLFGAETLSEQLAHYDNDANKISVQYGLTEHEVTSFETGVGLGLI